MIEMPLTKINLFGFLIFAENNKLHFFIPTDLSVVTVSSGFDVNWDLPVIPPRNNSELKEFIFVKFVHPMMSYEPISYNQCSVTSMKFLNRDF